MGGLISKLIISVHLIGILFWCVGVVQCTIKYKVLLLSILWTTFYIKVLTFVFHISLLYHLSYISNFLLNIVVILISSHESLSLNSYPIEYIILLLSSDNAFNINVLCNI